jgi:hypothetical protein
MKEEKEESDMWIELDEVLYDKYEDFVEVEMPNYESEDMKEDDVKEEERDDPE